MQNSDESEKFLMVVKNIYHHTKILNAEMGDIIVTDRGIYYVPYVNFTVYGKLGGALGAMTGGLAGGIATAVGQKNEYQSAIIGSDRVRNQDWGMSLEDRLKRHKGSNFIAKENITSYKINKNILVISASNQTLELLSDQLYDQILADYLSKKEIKPSEDSLGINILFPAPKIFFESLNSNTPITDIKLLSDMINDEKYMSKLWDVFEKSIPIEQRKKVIEKISRLPKVFAVKFMNHLEKSVETTKAQAIIFSVVGIPAIIGIIVLVNSWNKKVASLWENLSIIIGGLCFIFLVVGLYYFGKFQWYNHILNMLKNTLKDR